MSTPSLTLNLTFTLDPVTTQQLSVRTGLQASEWEGTLGCSCPLCRKVRKHLFLLSCADPSSYEYERCLLLLERLLTRTTEWERESRPNGGFEL